MTQKEDWLAYFTMLKKIGDTLEELTVLEEEKILAVTKGDLPKIDEIMKKEQAFAMTLRGHEQKRVKLLATLGIPAGKLSELGEHLPTELRIPGKRIIAQMKAKYDAYKIASNLARENLEGNLRQLESLTGQKLDYPQKSAQKVEQGKRKTTRDANGATVRTLSPEMEKIVAQKIQEREKLKSLAEVSVEVRDETVESTLKKGLFKKSVSVNEVTSKSGSAAVDKTALEASVAHKALMATKERSGTSAMPMPKSVTTASNVTATAKTAQKMPEKKVVSSGNGVNTSNATKISGNGKETTEKTGSSAVSKLSQFVRKKPATETASGGSGSSGVKTPEAQTKMTAARMAALDKTQVAEKKKTTTAPSKEIVDSLRKAQQDGEKKMEVTGNTSLNLRQEMLKKEQEASNATRTTTFKA